MDATGRMWLGARASEVGASLVEYAMLLALIAVVSIGAITLTGRETKREFACVAFEMEHVGARDHVSQKLKVDPDSLSDREKRYAEACDL